MRQAARIIGLLILLLVPIYGSGASADDSATAAAARPAGQISTGIGIVDITPAEPVALAGSPTPMKSGVVDSHLYVKALVISAGKEKIAIVTLDTNKYPEGPALKARQLIQQDTGIPASNIIICASHTHRAPLWSYYKDQLVDSIAQAAIAANRNLSPSHFAAGAASVSGINENRRVIKDGSAWNRWMLKPNEQNKYPPEGPFEPNFDILAIRDQNDHVKALIYNFACHAASTREIVISADFPGKVQKYIHDHMSPDVVTFYLTGASGNVNPAIEDPDYIGEQVGLALMGSLRTLEPISNATVSVDTEEIQMPGREKPEFNEADISLKWPGQVEHFRASFQEMMRNARPSYPFFMTGIKLGHDYAIVTSPDELFSEYGIDIEKETPFKWTMVIEQTNGAYGYVPTPKAFAGGGYETWFGDHSFLSTLAGGIIVSDSVKILDELNSQK